MLRWGILGTSFISETMAEALKKDTGSVITAVAGRTQKTIDAFAKTHSVQHTYTNYSELISSPEVDIVYIGLPNHLHHQYVIEAAQQDKHILCEKSLSVDMHKTQQIMEALSNHKSFFVEGLMYLHHPLINKLSDLISSNAIGAIKSVSGQYCADIAQFVNPDSKGAIYNLGCYPVSLIHLVLQLAYGTDVWKDYQLTGLGSLSDIDGNICEASLTLKLANGVTARAYTAETYGLFADFVILGEKGSLRFKSNPWLPEANRNIIELHLYDSEPQNIEVNAEGDAFDYQVKNIRKAIELNQSEAIRPVARKQDSFEIMELLTKWESSILAN